MNKNILPAFAAALLLIPASASASGYEFDGVGARAVARGGAVTADQDDWAAVYWNPAGLAGAAERQAGLEVRAGRMHTKDGNSFNIPGVSPSPFDKDRASSGFVLGSLGAVIPLGSGGAIGAGAYTPLLQSSSFKDTNPASLVATSLDYESSVVAGVANVSYARKLSERVSAGLGLNALYASLNSESAIGWGAAMGALANLEQKNESEAYGYGLEGVAGIAWQVTDALRAGAVVRSGAKIVLEGEEKVYLNGGLQERSDFRYPVRHPATSAAGVSWQARKDLRLTFDLAQAWWKGFSSRMTYDDPGALLTNRPNGYRWYNSAKLRLGALKRLDAKTEVMGGYAFDTWAIDRKSVDFSAAVDVPMHRFSAAVSRVWSPVETTLGALAGAGRRKSGGVDYSLGGWFVMGEVKYRF